MKKTKALLIIKGGIVEKIISTEFISVTVLDYDMFDVEKFASLEVVSEKEFNVEELSHRRKLQKCKN